MNKKIQLEKLPLDQLVPYARNSRTHSDAQVAQISASIREFGWTNPVLIDASGTIVAGHGRVLAARKLGLDEVPCIRLGHLTPAQVRAYVIADNKLALNAGWDEKMLLSELEALREENVSLDITGFSDEEIAELMGVEEEKEKPEVEINATFEVVAECENEEHQQMVYNILNEKGIKCRLLTL